VLDIASPDPGDVVLEIGAGTGEIGRHLASCVSYLGLDGSRAMLEVFRSKLADDPARVQLIQCDAERPWPVRDGAAAAVLASRVAHLLEPGHVVAEVRRVCRPGGWFLVGRVRRDPESVKSRLRKARATLLRDRGMPPRGGEQVTDRLLDRFVATGSTRLDLRPVASWTSRASAVQILDDWETMTTMGGMDLTATARAALLQELREWAARELGELAQVTESTEVYLLGGARIPYDAPAGASDAGLPSRTSEPQGTTWTTLC
jgi:SAM-dependent methyltransferase